jgi:Protein of unknown function (DUF998)
VGGRSTTRALVWLAFAVQAVFFASWIVAGALEPHYSHVESYVSELAARDAAHPWIETVGIVALGLSLVALGAALPAALGRRRGLAAASFGAAGVAGILAAVFPLDCATTVSHHCQALQDAGDLSWQHYAHLWLGLAETVFLALTPFALSRALWPGTTAAVLLGCGAFGLGIAVLSTFGHDVSGAADGLIQRFGFTVVLIWVLLVGAWVLWATRGAPRTSALIPMRPREFLSRSWSGEGELVLRPFLVGRLFAQRVEARRESVWISESVWRIDDEAYFGDGRFERRHMFCEFTSDDHVRLTGNDLIDGCDVWLEPEGFRLSEWRMAWPVGPIPLIVRCADRSYFEPDGTFVNRIDIYSLVLRIPVARVTFRMRSSAGGPASENARWQLDRA